MNLDALPNARGLPNDDQVREPACASRGRVLATASAREDSGAAATNLANAAWLTSPTFASSPASTSVPAIAPSSCSTLMHATSLSARARIASSSAASTAAVTFARTDFVRASSFSAPSAASLSAFTPCSSRPAMTTPAPGPRPLAPVAPPPPPAPSARVAASCAVAGSLFTITLFRMFLARAAYFSVFNVSSKF